MTIGLTFLIALVISIIVLGLAIMIYRHQRLLQEKKAMYLQAVKERGAHYRRYTTYQADLERLRTGFNSRLMDMRHLLNEIDVKKKEIGDILDILREETKQVDGEMDKDLVRIIERRKGMIVEHWKKLDGSKTLYLGKLGEARNDKASRQRLIQLKEEEFKALSQVNTEMTRLKMEYEQIARSSILSWRSK